MYSQAVSCVLPRVSVLIMQVEAELATARSEASGQLHAASLAESHLRQELDVQRRHGEDSASRLQAQQAACSELQQVCSSDWTAGMLHDSVAVTVELYKVSASSHAGSHSLRG